MANKCPDHLVPAQIKFLSEGERKELGIYCEKIETARKNGGADRSHQQILSSTEFERYFSIVSKAETLYRNMIKEALSDQ